MFSKILSFLAIFLYLQLNAQYSTPNTGVNWTLDDIAANSPGTVTVSGNEYTLHENLTVSGNDQLNLNTDLILKIAPEVEIFVSGVFICNSDTIVITAVDPENPYKGFWFSLPSEGYFANTLIEYGGGIHAGTPDFEMDNCEVSHHNAGSSISAALSFSNGSPIVKNCTFKFNETPAIGSAANTEVSALIENNYFEGNNQANSNRPQINMGPSGPEDSLRILNNTIIGDRTLTMVGGIASSSFSSQINLFVIKGNTVRDNRYGITSYGNSSGVIENNTIEDNDTEVNPMNGGSGISLYSTNLVKITRNEIRRNLWGVTIIGTAQANLGSDDTEDLNPGLNIFSENGNNGEIYALYNNTANPIKALHNCWIEGQESTADDVESVIFHSVDDGTLGEVFFDPFECGVMAVIDWEADLFQIYPNPTKGSFYINSNENGNLVIYDLNGKRIQNEANLIGTNQVQIHLPVGIYIVEFEVNGKKSTKKLVVK